MLWTPIFTKKENLSKEDLQALRSGEVSCLVIDDFYPDSACEIVSQTILNQGLKFPFKGENVVAYYSGLPAIDMVNRKREYFQGVLEANKCRKELFKNQLDPLEIVRKKVFSKIGGHGAEIASEEGNPYFAGVIRIFRKGVIHNDWAPRDMKGWFISNVTQQLSWNLFLQAPELGGEFQIWKRYWLEEDEKWYKHDPLKMKGYKDEVVANCQWAMIEPRPGRFILFDARNYHTIHDVKGEKERIVISSFAGLIDEESPLLLWS